MPNTEITIKIEGDNRTFVAREFWDIMDDPTEKLMELREYYAMEHGRDVEDIEIITIKSI